jgi:hypothetical protein
MEINETLRDLTRRIEKLENQPARSSASYRPAFVPGTLMSLPRHLRKTMEAIVTLGQAAAEEVAERTGRSRAAESDYLNQLMDRGFLKKQRVGKEVVFQVFDLHAVCPMCGSRVLLTARFCNICGARLSGGEETLARQSAGQI